MERVIGEVLDLVLITGSILHHTNNSIVIWESIGVSGERNTGMPTTTRSVPDPCLNLSSYRLLEYPTTFYIIHLQISESRCWLIKEINSQNSNNLCSSRRDINETRRKRSQPCVLSFPSSSSHTQTQYSQTS